MVKILCLHGYGTSARIMESQLQTIRSMADPEWEFVFVDGEVECKKAPGLGTFTSGPFLCYSDDFAPSNTRHSHDLITSMIEDEGPFDGVIGFSQGGSLTMSYLLEHAMAGLQPPFKWACIFSSVIAFSPDDDFRHDLLSDLTPKEKKTLSTYPDCDFSALRKPQRQLIETTAKAFATAKQGGFIAAHTNENFWLEDDLSQVPRAIHPSLTSAKIPIPTVHVTGKKDSKGMVELSKLMAGHCDERCRQVLTHAGGHDVSRQRDDAKKAIRAMEWAHRESAQQFW
ncbi:hypothetical protein M409DRAFT_53796 [Zasmidium cellare ATCC 36951]|uniref:Serine hydrolase domain-containing protein n=1 Tax=Zasmidium cellare ATCC 36951 TaxID=1080233 RepID=A0A6A6CKQ7_ZASCE|nr:uncharacterized protein M409DRAFT_53796 [Zasmidium cellare ATCC 36951]KAF2167837.1 hypothetical protein M409DRAFT_53796 [Zasmidium cellare ATCC 36951]